MTKKLTEAEQLAEDLKIAAYADHYIRKDRDAILYGTGGSDYFRVGNTTYFRTSAGWQPMGRDSGPKDK